jgi:3-oxoacyl-[acyl-carrier protein] reductase
MVDDTASLVGSRVVDGHARVLPARHRVALVTGSSRGLGNAIARRLARDGLAVAVNDARGEALEVAGAIRDDGGIANAFTADVTDERQVTELVAAVASNLGPVDVLVVNATGPQPEAPLEAVEWGDYLAQLSFFAKSPARSRGAPRDAGEAVRPHRPDRLRGRRPAASGQVGLRHRQERADRPYPQLGSRARHIGITVNTVAPGFIPVERHAHVPDEIRTAYVDTVPAGRMGTRDDIAHAVSSFASEAAGFITGQRLVVDGGRGLSD